MAVVRVRTRRRPSGGGALEISLRWLARVDPAYGDVGPKVVVIRPSVTELSIAYACMLEARGRGGR